MVGKYKPNSFGGEVSISRIGWRGGVVSVSRRGWRGAGDSFGRMENAKIRFMCSKRFRIRDFQELLRPISMVSRHAAFHVFGDLQSSDLFFSNTAFSLP